MGRLERHLKAAAESGDFRALDALLQRAENAKELGVQVWKVWGCDGNGMGNGSNGSNGSWFVIKTNPLSLMNSKGLCTIFGMFRR